MSNLSKTKIAFILIKYCHKDIKDINKGCNKEPLRAHTWLHHPLTMINVFF